jgi:thioredoxin-related protein
MPGRRILFCRVVRFNPRKTTEFIHENFLPVEAHIKEHPAWFHRFAAVWTPTVLLLDADGKERVRLEGYLSNRISPLL